MGGTPLSQFTHPEQAIYILEAEDYGLSKETIRVCDDIISLEAVYKELYNVAVAGSIVLYDRVFLHDRYATSLK